MVKVNKNVNKQVSKIYGKSKQKMQTNSVNVNKQLSKSKQKM